MLFNGSDIVKTKIIYKDHVIDGQPVRVFVDWGESTCEDYVIYGSPFQVTDGWKPEGKFPDSSIVFVEERVDGSFPQEGFENRNDPAPIHFKPGVNI